jgi:hypothetical protein
MGRHVAPTASITPEETGVKNKTAAATATSGSHQAWKLTRSRPSSPPRSSVTLLPLTRWIATQADAIVNGPAAPHNSGEEAVAT